MCYLPYLLFVKAHIFEYKFLWAKWPTKVCWQWEFRDLRYSRQPIVRVSVSMLWWIKTPIIHTYYIAGCEMSTTTHEGLLVQLNTKKKTLWPQTYIHFSVQQQRNKDHTKKRSKVACDPFLYCSTPQTLCIERLDCEPYTLKNFICRISPFRRWLSIVQHIESQPNTVVLLCRKYAIQLPYDHDR